MHEFVNDAEIKLRGYGVEIESWSTELGYGMIECAANALPPLQAADAAARFKLGFKELAKRHGLVATFIAKWSMTESGSSGHLHQSLLRDGENAFAGGEMDTLSETGRHYLGGLIDTRARSCRRSARRTSTRTAGRAPSCGRRPTPAGAGTTARRPSARSRSTRRRRGSSTAGRAPTSTRTCRSRPASTPACAASRRRSSRPRRRSARPTPTSRSRASRSRWRRPPTRSRARSSPASGTATTTSTTTSPRAAPRRGT